MFLDPTAAGVPSYGNPDKAGLVPQQAPTFFGNLSNGLFPSDPTMGIDPAFAKSQQNNALLNLGLGLLAASQDRTPGGLGRGILSAATGSQSIYQNAMQNAYHNTLTKKESEQRQTAFENTLAQQKQAQENFKTQQDLRQKEYELSVKKADEPQYHVKSQPLPDNSGLVQDYLIDLKDPEKVKKFGSPYKPSAQQVDQGSVETTAQMIASGQMPMISGMALKTPWGQSVVERVGQINPSYQAGDQPAIAKALRDFATGKEGNTVRSLNVSIEHLDTLSDLGKALNNGDVQLFNKIGNKFAEQTGGTAPTNFEAAKQIVSGEIVKAVTASGGGVTDRQEAQHKIDQANSPQQLNGVIDTYQKLLAGQLLGLQHQYETSTKRSDFNTKLSPKVIAKLKPLVDAANNQDASGPPKVVSWNDLPH